MTTRVSRYQKGTTGLDLIEAKEDGVLERQWHQLDHMQTICISQDNHTNTSSLIFFLQAGCSSSRKTNSVEVLRAVTGRMKTLEND